MQKPFVLLLLFFGVQVAFEPFLLVCGMPQPQGGGAAEGENQEPMPVSESCCRTKVVPKKRSMATLLKVFGFKLFKLLE